MRRRGLIGRRKAPKEKIIYGEKGVKGIRYSGEMPRDYRGTCTGLLYAFNERRPLLGIDARDVPGLVKEFGVDNLEERQPDGSFVSVATKRSKRKARAKKAEPEPEEQEGEKPQQEEDNAGGDE
ncbi:MAG: hypothetical protein GWN93_20665 [Deltaproteobacteria bacterium]|nr:hypothetical protein [Deltaproteobacteria bacterium]